MKIEKITGFRVVGESAWRVGESIYDFFKVCIHCRVMYDKKAMLGPRCPRCGKLFRTHARLYAEKRRKNHEKD